MPNNEEALLILQNQIYIAIAIFVLTVLITFIINGAIRGHQNKVFKAFINVILMIVLLILFGVCFIIDYALELVNTTYGMIPYIIALASSAVIPFVMAVINFIQGRKSYQHFSFAKINKRLDNSIKKNVYVIYCVDDKVILEKDKQGNYQGFTYPLTAKILFKDEMIQNIIEQNQLDVKSGNDEQLGTVTVNGKKTTEYHCFLITLNSIPESFANYSQIDKYEIINVPMNDFHKRIILRLLMKQQFDMEI